MTISYGGRRRWCFFRQIWLHMTLLFLILKYHTFIGLYMPRDCRISLLIRFVTDCLQKYIGFTNLKDVSTLPRRLWDWSTWHISYVSQQQTYISKTFKWDIYSQKANIYENPCKIGLTSRPNLYKKSLPNFQIFFEKSSLHLFL